MKSFEEHCRDNYNRIYKYIYALTGNRESAEDLIQDVFTVAFGKGDSFLRHENPPAFLYRTARNLTLTYLKRQQRYGVEPLDENTAGGDMDLCQQLLKDQDRQLDETAYALAVISRLDTKQQALYQERYVAHKPIQELALAQDVSEPAMRMRLMRLRREILSAVKDLKLDEM